MNVDLILSTLNSHHADYILIGGMNFFLNHQPVTTFDVDLWIEDAPLNQQAVHGALAELGTEVSFSNRGDDWVPVSQLTSSDWLQRQGVFCLWSPHGAIDIFRAVAGLEAGYTALRSECPLRQTPAGVSYRSLSDDLMVRCQLALPEPERHVDRLRALGYRPEVDR